MKKLLLFLIGMNLIACQKSSSTTVGNPVVSLNMTASPNTTPIAFKSFQEWLGRLLLPRAVASVPSTMLDAGGNSVALDQGWMVVKEIEFESTAVATVDEVDGSNVELLGPYVVDLFSATPQKLGEASLSLAAIRRIKMKLHPLEMAPVGAPSSLATNSIYFHGTVGGKEFTIMSHDGTELEIGGNNPLSVQSQMNILVSLRIVPLIAKIDLSAVASSSNGIIVSDDNKGVGTCPTIDGTLTTIFDCFRKGLEQQANLGEDANNSGDIESDETSVR